MWGRRMTGVGGGGTGRLGAKLHATRFPTRSPGCRVGALKFRALPSKRKIGAKVPRSAVHI